MGNGSVVTFRFRLVYGGRAAANERAASSPWSRATAAMARVLSASCRSTRALIRMPSPLPPSPAA